jgi:NAD(P)-dependent dehydrogenase (short-subunit alcohol dehydrogenase family)
MPRVILVTGASSGIGRYVAEYLGKKEFIVYAGTRKQADIDELSSISNVEGVMLDVTDVAQIQSAYDLIEQQVGHLDVLINNAGVPGWGALMDRSLEYIQRIMDVNLYGAIRMNKQFFPLLCKSKQSPTIINMSSQGGKFVMPFWGPYHMSKYALEAYSDALRRELDLVGVRVVVIQPGAITSKAFAKQVKLLEEYEKNIHSEFTPYMLAILEKSIRAENWKEKSPLLVAQDIEKSIVSDKPKLRYQPGRRLFPDRLANLFPQRVVDWFLRRLLKKSQSSS